MHFSVRHIFGQMVFLTICLAIQILAYTGPCQAQGTLEFRPVNDGKQPTDASITAQRISALSSTPLVDPTGQKRQQTPAHKTDAISLPPLLIVENMSSMMETPTAERGDKYTDTSNNQHNDQTTKAPLTLSHLDIEWGGQFKILGSLSWPGGNSQFQPVGLSPNADWSGELRLTNKIFLDDIAYTEIHYEALARGGNTRSDGKELARKLPFLFPDGLVTADNDDRRLMDLTWTTWKDESSLVTQRIDRLMLALTPDWGEIRLGRQALTWGNGLVFNPLDLFNPFSPTDTLRDYKIGADMAVVQFPTTLLGTDADVQLVYTARRDPLRGRASFEQASLGGKIHLFLDGLEIDLLAAKHYEDQVAGVGLTGYLGGMAWRVDSSWTFLAERTRGRSGYLSVVANLDGSWSWFDRNWYGLLEYHHSGLSSNDLQDQFTDVNIAERIGRGELFGLGRDYLAGSLDVELHPLVSALATGIVNLDDHSFALLPGIRWSLADNIELQATASLYAGDRNTEYGGYERPVQPFLLRPSDTVSTWLTFYF